MTPAEVAALAVLLLGAVALTVVVWWQARPLPHEDRPSGGEAAALVVATEPGEEVLVHVSGAVGMPGVVRLSAGARVVDAIQAAGGAADDARLEQVNLAREVRDGEQVLVPSAGEHGGEGPVPPVTADGRLPDGRLDLNAASAVDLQALPGVGPVTAARIVSHREVIGRFDDVTQLLEVRGIGPATFAAIEPEVGV